jgi:hypothetical protein
MRLLYEVAAKVENMTDGATFMLHGSMTVEDRDGEPMTLAFRVDRELWDTIECGDVLAFELNPQIHRPSLDN